MEEQQLVNVINILLQCNPNYCRYSDCPLYFTEVKKCDAGRAINMIKINLDRKFEIVKPYDPIEDLNIS